MSNKGFPAKTTTEEAPEKISLSVDELMRLLNSARASAQASQQQDVVEPKKERRKVQAYLRVNPRRTVPRSGIIHGLYSQWDYTWFNVICESSLIL